jgi:regulator of replication initiation timing
MIFTSEQIKTARKNLSEKSIFDQWVCFGDMKKEIFDFIDTIEAQQQEIEQLMALAGKMNVCDLVRENLRLNNRLWHTEADLEIQTLNAKTYLQECEQLRAKNGAMREALETIKGLELEKDHESVTYNIANNALSTYHNPADVEALAKYQATIKTINETTHTVHGILNCGNCRKLTDRFFEKAGGRQ